MIRAQIYRSAQREFDCKIIESGELVSATALGNLLKFKDLVIGDYVLLEQNDDEYVIHEREDRSSEVYRVNIREAKKKVTAANCDNIVIVSSVSKPKFKRGILDRFLLRSVQWNLRPIIIFNKMDELNPKKLDLAFEMERLANLSSYFKEQLGDEKEIIFVENSAKDNEFNPRFGGVDPKELMKVLKGSISLFVGQSGVGKSTLINQFTDNEFELLTKVINKSGKGSHTTTWSEVIEARDFRLIDTPGIRSFSIDDLLPEEILPLFPDLHPYVEQCQFPNCEHDHKAQGCYFQELDESADKAVLSRLESFTRVMEDVAENKAWEKM